MSLNKDAIYRGFPAEMSSEARKKNGLKNKKDPVSTSINGYVELKAAIFSSEVFSNFSKEIDENENICLSLENINIKLIGPDFWHNKVKYKELLKESHDSNDIVFLVGKHPDFGTHQEMLKYSEFQMLHLPLTVDQIYLKIKSLHNFHLKFANKEEAYKQIEKKNDSIKYVLKISKELNGIRDSNKLLSSILEKAREVAGADAGSIYVVEWKNYAEREGVIHFKITQNESVEQDLSEFQIMINKDSIVGSCVIQGKTININDLYRLGKEDSSSPRGMRHDKSWDLRLGYQCRSMVTIPMFDISNKVIGVIQLINKKVNTTTKLLSNEDFENNVTVFDSITVEFVEIVAHQAGIALENALLTEEREKLFEGFVHASVTAIERRDPTTSGHSHRVAALTVNLAKLIDGISVGPYTKISFNEDQLKEIEYASLLHDFGKLGVREEVLTKAKKLYPGQKNSILFRFDQIRMRYEIEYLEEMLKYRSAPWLYPPGFSDKNFIITKEKKCLQLDKFYEFILSCDEPSIVNQGGFDKLKEIAGYSYRNARGSEVPFLSNIELNALSVSRGSLTREEFTEIQSHVQHTYEFLRKIPWGTKFSNVPEIAAKHHEKLDGTGYPNAATGQEIPVQSRMMTIADIFDALTAADRPYKKALSSEKALDILNYEVKSGKVDEELFRIFVESEIYKTALENN